MDTILDILTHWMVHVIFYLKPTKKYSVVLDLDEHTSLTRNTDVIDFARKNGFSIAFKTSFEV